MADTNTIIEGSVKFREGRKWKSRWCVMRRLSPVADCVQLQVYSEAAKRSSEWGGSKAALSLEQFVGAESGFTLDKQSNTLALVCRDLVALMAFDTRERLLQWQVKARAALGESRQRLVIVAAAPRRSLKGPARLHLRSGQAALTAGLPPRLLGLWDLRHLRRYGIVEGRFCFEGGSHCGKGEGLHVLVSDRAEDIARDFELAARGELTPERRPSVARRSEAGSPESQKAFRPDTRLSELSAERPSQLRLVPRDSPDGDATSLVAPRTPFAGVSLERCVSCMSKLGAMSRSSTGGLTPGAKAFTPAWTMEALSEAEAQEPKEACVCPADAVAEAPSRVGVGPYENYDVPRFPRAEADGEYYDTPKRLKESLESELFKIARGSADDAIVLKKPCGCLLKVGRRRIEPTVVETDENFQPADCPCRRVTAWANAWIGLPYCKKYASTEETSVPNKENVTPNGVEGNALYATVDVARKTRRKTWCERRGTASRSLPEIDDGPLAHYENLNFALSLEHYENAKDLLRRAGVTRAELEAIGASLRPSRLEGIERRGQCGRSEDSDEYLLMEPEGLRRGDGADAHDGYTPMSPVAAFALHTLRANRPDRLRDEKAASNPSLCAAAEAGGPSVPRRGAAAEGRKRSSSADSSRFLEDVEEFEGSVGSRSSSLETLRGAGDGGEGRSDARARAREEDGDTATTATRPAPAAANRDSSSSNDSGVSICSREAPRTSAATRARWRIARRDARAHDATATRRARSQGPLRFSDCEPPPPKSSSAEAEVPVLLAKALRGAVGDTHSTSSGTSDMSDYVETLSLCSSHSSSDTPVTMRACVATSLLRPRSGREYLRVPLAPPRPPRVSTANRPPPAPPVHAANENHRPRV